MMLEDVGGVEAEVVLDDLDVGVERLDRVARRLGLRHADPLGVVDHLALQVGGVDDVVVDQAEGADPGGGEVERGGRAEPAGAEQQDLGVQQLELAVDADLGEQRVARVAVALLGRHALGGDHRQPLLLPGEDPAGHRGDVVVAELLQLLGRDGGAVAGAAVEDRAGRLVRRGRGDLVAEQARRHQLAALEVGLLVLVRLAGVDQDDVAALDLLRGLERLDLLDLLWSARWWPFPLNPPNPDQLYFKKYSGVVQR